MWILPWKPRPRPSRLDPRGDEWTPPSVASFSTAWLTSSSATELSLRVWNLWITENHTRSPTPSMSLL
uniref:Uncharacterized protein n=1 Tax=Steinernema glaseri TaxID=37863 RepID=A0A1I8A336_9BILA